MSPSTLRTPLWKRGGRGGGGRRLKNSLITAKLQEVPVETGASALGTEKAEATGALQGKKGGGEKSWEVDSSKRVGELMRIMLLVVFHPKQAALNKKGV